MYNMVIYVYTRHQKINGSDRANLQVMLDDGYDGMLLYDNGDKVSLDDSSDEITP